MQKHFIFSLLCFLPGWLFVARAEASDSLSVATKNLSHYSFNDKEGKSFRLDSLKGNYVYLEIWSISCGPCLREMEQLDRLKPEFKDAPIRFVAICVENNETAWRAFLERRKLSGLHLITPIFSPFLKENGFIAVPRFVLLDKNGKIIHSQAPKPSDPKLKQLLTDLSLQTGSQGRVP